MRTIRPLLAWTPTFGEPMGPIEPVLARLDPLLAGPIGLSEEELRQLVDFVRDGLLDDRARPEKLRKFIPGEVPSGRPTMTFL